MVEHEYASAKKLKIQKGLKFSFLIFNLIFEIDNLFLIL